MTIILSSQTSLNYDNVIGNALGSFGETIGIPGFPYSGGSGKATSDILAVQDKMNSVFNTLLGCSSETFDPNFVESGRQIAIGSGIEGGKGPNVETANTRKNYSQTPQASILIKKRAFSSLQDLYNPVYMDPAEKWLLRATKRLVARKCKIMADYERLTKIEKLVDAGTSLGVILASLISSGEEEEGNNTNFSSMMEFKRVVFDRQPVRTTTYFIDTDMPLLEELGFGSGVFEITAVANLNTALSIEGESSFSMNIEDPYKILFITEEDIDAAIRETALSGIVNTLDTMAGEALNTAQTTEAILAKRRRDRGKSEITIEVGLNFGAGVKATIDAIGLQINENNLNDVPSEQALDSTEQGLFVSVISSLKSYQDSLNKNLLMGASLTTQTEEVRKQMNYTRDKMRIFYLGKSLIQPMDTVNIFIDGGTRRAGETEDVENGDIFSFEGAVNFAANALGLRNTVIDDELLFNEWERAGEFPDFETFKKLRTLSLSTESGVSVFGGFVTSVVDQFNADSGSYTLSVSGTSNMGWLDLSRYNAQPSLDQTQGVVYDPMTPFDIETDKATGLPTGKVSLSTANQQMLSQGCYYFNTGPNTGQKITSTDDMRQDVLKIGNNIINLYQHAPGLVYKWKEGIMTATYNASATTPLDGSMATLNELRRDVGFFASNTPFDNMDAANVLSVLITGMPYNPATFVQSALNTGAYNPDTTLNSGKDYFHSMLSMQKSNTKANGGFVPFKSITIDPLDLARSIYYQRRIFDKSSELSRLRNQEAKLQDQIANISKNLSDPSLKKSISSKLTDINTKINSLATDLSELSKSQNELGKNLITVAGSSDVAFDLGSITNNEEYRLFGDKLSFAVLRRREDVIRNKDKNYFIVSDDYDKDYDIQAFVMKLRDRAPDMWKSSWQPLKQLCKQVAETLDFEFFCDSNGHVVFRPPQYNRTPRTLLEQMLLLNNTGGIKLFPDFLPKLFQTREQSLLSQVESIEWEIRMNSALLGKKTIQEISTMLAGRTGSWFEFITNNSSALSSIINASLPLNPQEQEELKKLVSTSNSATQLTNSSGLFDAISQINLQNDILSRNTSGSGDIGNQSAYENAVKNLAALTGNPIRTYPAYDDTKVGAVKNGQSTPASDVARIISNIDNLVVQRAQILRSLEKVIEQNIEVATVSEDGTASVSKTITNVDDLPDDISEKLIEDDRRDYLGHMSGARFIIQDESIFDCSFTETPPEFTIATVTGSMPIVGEQGNLAGMPVLTAFGVDFDLWRQYGFRAEKPFDKPFFSSAEYQCAPYAVMLLSRQRKNIVTGTITVVGNEFYQLGDVVYVAHRQMLYYVTRVSHSFDYIGNFKTTLELKYGHPPGQYIPTPLDLIGKMQITKGNSQSSYRIRRETPRLDVLIGTAVFEPNNDDVFAGKHAKRNYEQLVNALTVAQTEIDRTKPKTSPRLYCCTFFGLTDLQQSRCESVQKWLNNPVKPASAMGGQGINGLGGNVANTVSSFGGSNDVGKYRIDPNLVKIQVISQDYPDAEDLALLEQGIVASQETFALDPPNFGVVEIRLRQPPVGGWTDG